MSGFPFLDGLSAVELQAARLDGECYRVLETHVSISVPESPALRAVAALRGRSERLVAARGTAAWIWGAAPTPPARAEFLVALSARWRPRLGDEVEVIESVVLPEDRQLLGHVAVTTPLRTVLDLVRFREVFTAADADAVRRLAAVGGFGVSRALEAMDRGRNLAGKRRAAERLRGAFAAVQPELTR